MNKGLTNQIIKEYNRRFPSKKFTPGESPVPVSGKIFDEKEMLLMTEAVLDGWWTEGRLTNEFETKLAKFLGVSFCITVNSGSSANLLAFMALTSHLLGPRRLKPGDEVITVAAGFPTTVNPIVQAGCIPVFVDIELETLSIDVTKLEQALSSKTKAVMIAHALGNPFDLSAIQTFCKKNNLWFIEDNCDGLGSEYNGKKTGSFGDISTLSFYPAHHITAGEGGAVFTNDALLKKIIRSLRDWGRDCWCATGKDNTCGIRFKWQLGNLPKGYDHKYTYSHLGYNLKMTEMQAACGLAQLGKLARFTKSRKRNYKLLREKLEPFSDYFTIVQPTPNSDPSWFGLLITLTDKCNFTREDLLTFLNDRKIATRLLFGGNLTRQPYFINNKIKYRTIGALVNTDKVMRDTFWIGTYPGITLPMINWVAKSFQDFIDSKTKSILIAGATGFIGSHFTKKILEAGYSAAILKRSSSDIKRIKPFFHKLKSYDLDKKNLEDIFKQNRFKLVINFATDYGRKHNNKETISKTNIDFPKKLIFVAAKNKVQTYYNIDTSLDKNINEYAHTKYLFRKLLPKFQDKINIVNLRLEYVYGPNDDETKFLPFAISKLKKNQNLDMSPGEQKIDFVYIDDCVNGIINVITETDTKAKFQEFQIGSGKSVKLKSIITGLKKALKSTSNIKFGAIPYRKHEQMYSQANIKNLNWQPKHQRFNYQAMIRQNETE